MNDFKESVKCAAPQNVVLAGGAPSSVDGVQLGQNDRVLVFRQTPPSGRSFSPENGIYRVQVVGTGNNGTWVRAGDMDEVNEVSPGLTMYVENGALFGKKIFVCTSTGKVQLGVDGLRMQALDDILNVPQSSTPLQFQKKILANGVFYDTIQAAYDAVKSLANPSNLISVVVGVGTASDFGGISLSSDWNTFVVLKGFGPEVSGIGSINGTSAQNGRSVQIAASDLQIASIVCDTTDTGTMYNSGSVSVAGSNVSIDSIQSRNSKNAYVDGSLIQLMGSVTCTSIDGSTTGPGKACDVVIGDNSIVGSVSVTNLSGDAGDVVVGKNALCSSGIAADCFGDGSAGQIQIGYNSRAGNITAKLYGTNTLNPGSVFAEKSTVYEINLSGTANQGGSVTLSDSICMFNIDVSGTSGGNVVAEDSAVTHIDAHGASVGGNVTLTNTTAGQVGAWGSVSGGNITMYKSRADSVFSYASVEASGTLRFDSSRVYGIVMTGSAGDCVITANDSLFLSPSACFDRAGQRVEMTNCVLESSGTYPCIQNLDSDGATFVNTVMRPQTGFSIESTGSHSVRAYNLIHNNGFNPVISMSDGYAIVPSTNI
jgi:hypothetical protein